MCGITGQFLFDPNGHVSPEAIWAMNHALSHRGQDDVGVLCRGAIGLGSQRLAIVDIEGGRQPISDSAGSTWIVFNGEISNHRELRLELQGCGYRFNTRTDTEVILHAYDQFGLGCVDRLSGMFAFAIWDEPRQSLFIARDRLGIKPLFYTVNRTSLCFASEIKALLAMEERPAEPDRESVAEYLFCGFPLDVNTFFSGILALAPGHMMVVDARGVHTTQYWDVCFDRRWRANDDEHSVLEFLYTQLNDSVMRALDCDAPVGSCLSGGLDSSLVTALAARLRPALDTFNIGYARNSTLFCENPGRIVGEVIGDDYQYALHAAQALRTKHHPYILPVDTLLEDIDRMIWHREKPLITLSEYGHFRLSHHAAETVKVLLSGQGSDELFGGYYYWWRYREPQNTSFFPWVARTDPARPGYPVTATDVMDTLVTEDFSRETRYREAQAEKFNELMVRADTDDFFNKISYLLIKTHLHEILEIEDRHSMAHSIEMRVPFLEHRLVEWALDLPAHAKVGRNHEKLIVKKMIQRYLPEFPQIILSRKKSPMPPPFEIEGLVGAMIGALRRRDLAIASIINGDRLDAFLSALEQPQPRLITPRHYTLFSLYFLERWYGLFQRGGAAGVL